jgi:hypothetical protein
MNWAKRRFLRRTKAHAALGAIVLSISPQALLAQTILDSGPFSILNRTVEVKRFAPTQPPRWFGASAYVMRVDSAFQNSSSPLSVDLLFLAESPTAASKQLIGFTVARSTPGSAATLDRLWERGDVSPEEKRYLPTGPAFPALNAPVNASGGIVSSFCKSNTSNFLDFGLPQPEPCEITNMGIFRKSTISGYEFEEISYGYSIPYTYNLYSPVNGIGIGYNLGLTTYESLRLIDLPAPRAESQVIEFRNTADFPGAPGGNFFYTADASEAAFVDAGGAGRFVRTGKSFNAGGFARTCRYYGSQRPGPNSHFYSVSESDCQQLRSLMKTPIPTDAQQWNFEGLSFATGVPRKNPDGSTSCSTGTIPVFRAYNRAFADNGTRNRWDSNHRFSTNRADIDEVVALGWKDEGVAMCAPT